MPAEARKAIILNEASAFFAHYGFEASTRDLADKIGVRQALLYKYFTSKEALIDAIFDVIMEERRDARHGGLSADHMAPLVDRIVTFYDTLAQGANGSAIRLIVRATLENLPVVSRLDAFTESSFFAPLIAELRELEHLPDSAAKPIMLGEMELAKALHAPIVYLAMRQQSLNEKDDDHWRAVRHLLVSMSLVGVRHALRELHLAGAPELLSVPLSARH